MRTAFLGSWILAGCILLNGAPFIYYDSYEYLAHGRTLRNGLMDLVLHPFGGAPQDSDREDAQGSLSSLEASSPREGAHPEGGDDLVDDDGPYVKGRSPYYGLWMSIPWPGSLPWPGIWLQCLAVAAVLATAARAAVPGMTQGRFLGILALLTVLTPAGVFAGLAMPDVWAAVGIMAWAACLALWRRFSLFERLGLLAAIAFAAVSHQSHLAVVGGLNLAVFAGTRVGRSRVFDMPLAASAGAVVIALALNVSLDAAIEARSGQRSMSLPFFSAHLTDAGPGLAYLDSRCPDPSLELCRFRDRLPLEWRAFMFEGDPQAGVFSASDVATQRRLAEQDVAFAVGTFLHDPASTVVSLAFDGFEQVFRFSLATTPIRAPVPIAPADLEGRLYHAPGFYSAVTVATYGTTVICAILWVAASVGAGPLRRLRRDRVFWSFGCLVFLGVVGNAFVCGGLASPYDRFQARVVWLIPYVVALGWTWVRAQELSERNENE